MDAMQLEMMKMMVVGLVQAETGKTNAQVERCITDCQKMEEAITKLRSRVDFAEGAELKVKLDRLLESSQSLAVNDATQTEQIVTIFKKLEMETEAKQALDGLNVTINANSSSSSDAGDTEHNQTNQAGAIGTQAQTGNVKGSDQSG